MLIRTPPIFPYWYDGRSKLLDISHVHYISSNKSTNVSLNRFSVRYFVSFLVPALLLGAAINKKEELESRPGLSAAEQNNVLVYLHVLKYKAQVCGCGAGRIAYITI